MYQLGRGLPLYLNNRFHVRNTAKVRKLTSHLFFCLSVFWLASTVNVAVASSATVISLSQEQASVWLTPEHIQYLVQNEDSMGDRILGGDESLPWLSPHKPSINLGKFKKPVWVRFEVKNESNHLIERTLEIQWVHLAKLNMYQLNKDGDVLAQYKAGLTYDPHEHYQHSDKILFPIRLDANQTSHILLKIETSFIVFLPMQIIPENLREKEEFLKYVVYSVAFGILLAMALYNGSLFVFTRDSTYFYYSIYVLAIILYSLGVSGIGVRFVWPESYWLRMNGYALSVYLSFLCAAIYVLKFLEIKSYGGWVYYTTLGIIGVWCVIIADLIVGPYLRSITELISLITCLLALFISIYLWFKGNISARYFTIAWSFLIFSTVVMILMLEGVIAQSFLTQYGQMSGFVMEVLMLSFAMAERINRERETREKAQADALHLQVVIGKEREDKLAAQENLLSMQQQINSTLEQRVKQRTLELERTLSSLESANKELAKLSTTDPLTKVHNRRYFDDALQKEIQRSQRTGQPLALVLVDIDHFKQFNDCYGHLVGDDCLKLVASVIKNQVTRSSDIVARYGGEEFAIIFVGATEEQGMELAESVRSAIANLRFICRGERIPVSASFGVVGKVATIDCTPDTYIEAADKALYQAKRLGRNCCISSAYSSQQS